MMAGPRAFRAACLVLLAAVPPLWAVRQEDEGSGAGQAGGESSEDVAQAATGMVLRERYVLREFLERRAVPGRSFPQITRRGLDEGEHLGQGSFGDVWKAYDTKMKKDVAVKIFYVNSKPYGPRYLTWTEATQHQKQELRENAKECKLIKDMLGHATMDAKGASRICACYAEHVLDAEHTSKVTFLVQEMCGRSLAKHFLEPHRKQRTADVREARKLTMQLVEGLEFLQRFTPPIIHHDLKPDNVCVSDEGVKIIDWGGVVFASNSAMYEPAVATPLYTPPEADGKPGQYPKAFEMPAYSYDVYATGLVFMEMLCPALDAMAWYHSRPLSEASIAAHVARACPQLKAGPDLRVIGRMTHQSASLRPSPMDLLEDPLFAPPEAKPALPPTAGPGHRGAERFSVGDRVEYWSTTHRKWMSGIVVNVHPGGRAYDIDQENGQRLKYGAPAERIRRQGLKFKAGDRVEYMSSSKRAWLPGRILRVNEDSSTYDLEYTYGGELYQRKTARPDSVRTPSAHVDASYRPNPSRRFSQFHHGAPGANQPVDKPWRQQLIHPIIEQQGEDEEVDRNGQYQLGSEISLDDPTVKDAGGSIEVNVWVKCDYNVGCSYDRAELQHAALGAKEMPIAYRGEASGIALASVTVARDDPWVGSVCKVQAFATTSAGKKVKSMKRSVFVRR